MRPWSILSTLALAGALGALPTYADEASSVYERLPLPYGDALTRSDMQDAANSCQCVDVVSVISATEVPEEAIIEGQVAAVEHESGRFVLDTDEGLLGLTASPDELTGVEIGDVVRVSFVTDESD
jgi:hypothetical protein